MRVVEVWLDEEFREYFYTREPMVRGYPIGDISKQLQFKKDHNCKSFKWFMDNIAYDVYYQFPKLPPNRAWGEVGHALFRSGLLVGLNECILFLLLCLSCDSPGSREVRGEGEEPRALCKMWMMIGEHCLATVQGAGRSEVRGRSLELFAKCEWLVNILWQSSERGGQSAETHRRSGRGWDLELFTKCQCEWWLVTWFCDSSRSGEAKGAGMQWDREWVEGPLAPTSVTMVVTTR